MKHFYSQTKHFNVLFALLAMLLVGVGSALAQKALPYEYGFETTLTEEGWTTVSAHSSSGITNTVKYSGTQSLPFYYRSNPPQYLISPELSVPANATNVKVSFYYRAQSTSYTESFKVGYSTTDNDVASFTWEDETSTNNTTFQEYTTTFPKETKYIAIAYTADYQYYLFVDDISLNFDAEGSGLNVLDGDNKITSGYSYDFGMTPTGTTKVFTLSNPGTETTNISVSHTGNFGVELSATSIPAGESVTLTVTMPETSGSDAITISSTDEGIEDFVINVSGTIRDANKVYLDFADGTIPEGWHWEPIGSSASAYLWSVSEGYISWARYGGSFYAWAFTSPELTFANGETILFETAKYGTSSYYNPSITVEYSLDGTTWTAIGSAFTDDVYDTWTPRSVTIPVDGVKYIRFNGWYIHMRNIYGGQEPAVAAPKALTASDITKNTATLSWTSNATTFNIQYKAEADADWTTIENVTENPYTLTGLAGLTTYQVQVQADFGTEGVSSYCNPITFTTKVGPITEYPYTENFNSLSSGQIPAGWDNSEGTTTNDAYKWVYWGAGHDGACIRFNSYNNQTGITNMLKTRPFAFTEGKNMQLSFWYKNPKGGDFSVYISTDGGSTYPTALATGLTGKSDWTEMKIDIPASIYGDNIVFVFKGTSNYGSGDAYIYLDDMTVSEKSDYAMAISGEDVVDNTIAFGTVKNTTTAKTFTIKNDGGNDLTGISVVSSDEETFTVSETDFDLAVSETKDITVTFVKAIEGSYNGTITISQANVDAQTINVTATYQTPTPATMSVTINGADVEETVAFGIVAKATTKIFTVVNGGEATLNATIEKSGADADCFTLSATTIEVEGASNQTFSITFDATEYDVEKTATITLTDGNLTKTFNVTGTRGDIFCIDFEDSVIPEGFENNGFVVKTGTVGNYPQYTVDSYWAIGNGGVAEKTLITPLLVANNGDKFTFDGFFYYGDETMKVDYSTDLTSWTNLYTYDKSSYENGSIHNIEITAPITGEFYLRFTVNYFNGIDNLVGFKYATAREHEAVIASYNIPASGNQFVEYTATVTVKEKAGKEEEVIAELWIGEEKVATTNATLTANADTEIALTFTPDKAMSGNAYIAVYNDEIDLTTEEQAVTIAGALVLDDTAAGTELTQGTYPAVLMKYIALDGWNTICVPFALTSEMLNSIFGEGWKAYEFKSYANGELGFSTTTTFYAGYPYIIYVETAASNPEGVVLHNVNIARTTAQYDYHSGAYFRGTYAPVTDGNWVKENATNNIYGVTSEGKIRKAGTSASIDGFRAYFELPATVSNPSLVVDGIATGINDLQLNIDKDAVIYDMSGRRVDTLSKGIYIINGKKVIVK